MILNFDKNFIIATVTTTVNKWFSKASTLDLKVLAALESQITSEIHEGTQYIIVDFQNVFKYYFRLINSQFFNLGATSFDRLGHGSFLKFVTENKNLNRMLEFGTATSADVIGTKVTKEELIHFVIQCGGGRKKVHKKSYEAPSGCFFTVKFNFTNRKSKYVAHATDTLR